ncbi:Plasmodium variant antigen protein Cir/Yir/Bir, putative [Plasmodium chabaudi adami]|uniref:Plasmodium variant antigen protein Cir/Yir/Bir, putative n=1 Tax=Plasmodium chabaudi adami TaxID=5826 RepID=A0A1D3L8U2_PLACE|nr:Plasmodium variant antigen protein Cir/Yir/Bir, putative [Plasmodium chabaudi adami]
MANSSYDIEKVYSAIKTISNYFEENNVSILINNPNATIHNYCHYNRTSDSNKCLNYFEMTSSDVIHLLKDLKDKYYLEDDKLAEYGILWLIYKLKIKEKDKLTDLNKFYTDHMEKNEYYNDKINGDNGPTYKEIIDKKINLMDMNINDIFKLEAPFNILYYLYYEIHDGDPDCDTNLKLANNFVQNVETLNNDSNNIKDSPFSQILSTLSNDYKNLKKKCTNFPSIQELTPKNKPVEKSAKVSEQPTVLNPEATPSSSSILNTVIPVLSTFAIPVFLGVAYKYSLFGIDKLFQRQHIRNKLKKTTKKMELNI